MVALFRSLLGKTSQLLRMSRRGTKNVCQRGCFSDYFSIGKYHKTYDA